MMASVWLFIAVRLRLDITAFVFRFARPIPGDQTPKEICD
jgi:hypothetical protein